MNPDTGELRALRRGEAMPEGFDAVPDFLHKLASLKLRTHQEEPVVRVNLRGASPLALWAKKKRKAKIAAASRRRNRK